MYARLLCLALLAALTARAVETPIEIEDILLLYRTPGGLKDAMPLLVDHTSRNPDDWVALQYLAGGYQLTARKLASANLPENDAWKMVVAAFSKSESARLRAKGESDLKAFLMPRTTILRHAGDALLRLGREEEARAVYARGVEESVWTNPLCRPEKLFETDTALGYFFELDEVLINGAAEQLKNAIASLDDNILNQTEYWRIESSGLHTTNSWSQLPLVVNNRQSKVCNSFPDACEPFMDPTWLNAAVGQVKLSKMIQGTHVRPHAGPTMERLRVHCLVSGASPSSSTFIRVGDERRTWQKGKCFAFDESCEHEVHIGAVEGGERIVLIADVPNPFLSWEDFVGATADGDSTIVRSGWEELRSKRSAKTEEL
mmetsp:Transcript_26845/g.53539  ORF Transcript_26845/g.53539 Transcript_26845/m.53539 type:complete len:373 (-) Transcript_26845:7-1125(-)